MSNIMNQLKYRKGSLFQEIWYTDVSKYKNTGNIKPRNKQISLHIQVLLFLKYTNEVWL